MNDPRFDSLPADETQYPERLARDLAWGTLHNRWRNEFYLQGIPAWRELRFSENHNPDLERYLKEVWNNHQLNPALPLLEDLGYIEEVPNSSIGDDTSGYKLTEKALKLARTVPPGPIFISYRRSESSAFALLLADRLKARELTPFLDNQPDEANQGVSLKPGGKWEDNLREAILAREYLVVLIGRTTLSSKTVRAELQYALEFHKQIIPIWHNGFDPSEAGHIPNDLPVSIKEVITQSQAIRVVDEDPQYYDLAVDRLVSLFQ